MRDAFVEDFPLAATPNMAWYDDVYPTDTSFILLNDVEVQCAVSDSRSEGRDRQVG